jgi:hypothetical protein
MQNKQLTILLGLSLVLLILWNRLRMRLPREFIDVIPTHILILLISIIITAFLLVFVVTLKTLIRPPKPTSLFSQLLSHRYVLHWLRIKDYIINAPYKLYEIIFDTINLLDFVLATASPLAVYCHYPKLTYTLFFLLPRVTVSTIFIIDLCYMHQFTYFYNSLLLLLIPLLTYFYLFMVGHLATVNIMFFDKHLDIERGDGEVTVSIKDVQPTFEDAMDISKITLSHIMRNRLIFKTILDFASDILFLKNRKEPYLLLYTSLCYLIGWSYYLWFITNPSIDTFSLIEFILKDILCTIFDHEEPFSGHDI